MRHKVSVVIAALFAAATLCIAQAKPMAKAPAGDKDQMVIQNSRATWEAYKSRNVAGIKALTGEDYVSYTQEGPSNLKQDIDTIGKLTIEAYTLDDPKVTWATKDVAILRYKCDLKGNYDGKAFKPVYATEVWVNRGGKWQIVSYTETPLK